MMNAMTVQEAERDLAGLVARVVADAEPTIVISDNGEQVVVVSLDEYNSWKETLYLLSSPANATHLRKSIAESKAGQKYNRDMTGE